MLDEVLDSFDDVDPVQSPESAHEVLERKVRELGFEHFTHIAIRPRDEAERPFFLTNYPGPWCQRYVEHEYFAVDPVLHGATTGLKPFSWAEVGDVDNLTRRQAVVMREAADHGLRHGGAIPIHAPNGGLGVFTVAHDAPWRAFQDIWRGARPLLHSLALAQHDAIERAVRRGQTYGTYLTERERDILLWSARGKTAWEISVILAVSRETVNFHMKKIAHKLNATSKHHAVVKGVMQGHIVP